MEFIQWLFEIMSSEFWFWFSLSIYVLILCSVFGCLRFFASNRNENVSEPDDKSSNTKTNLKK